MRDINYLLTGAGLHLLAVHLTATMGNWDIPTSNIIQVRGSATNTDRYVTELQRLYDKYKNSKEVRLSIYVVGLKHNHNVINVMKKMLEAGMKIRIFHTSDSYLKNNISHIIPYFKAGSNIFLDDSVAVEGLAKPSLGAWFLSFTTGLTKPQVKAIQDVDDAVMCTVNDNPLTEVIRGMVVILSKLGTMCMLKNIILANTHRGGSFNLMEELTKDTMISLNCALNALQKTRHIQYVLQDKLYHNVSVQDIDKFISRMKEVFVNEVFIKHVQDSEIEPIDNLAHGGLKTTTAVPKLGGVEEIHGVYCVNDIDGYVKYINSMQTDETSKYKMLFALIPEDDYISVQIRSMHQDVSAIVGLAGLNNAFRKKLGGDLIHLIGGTNKSGGGQIKYDTYAKILYML